MYIIIYFHVRSKIVKYFKIVKLFKINNIIYFGFYSVHYTRFGLNVAVAVLNNDILFFR